MAHRAGDPDAIQPVNGDAPRGAAPPGADHLTAGLDAPGFEVLARLLAEARGRGATVIFASHLLSDLHEHCDELLLLLEGRIAAKYR